ncbi:hypothetical protein PSP6_160015 [Paraburkholderia tropica]|nr:hypothetical protein PSP6_160015 [Paraburkholderia tropica]
MYVIFIQCAFYSVTVSVTQSPVTPLFLRNIIIGTRRFFIHSGQTITSASRSVSASTHRVTHANYSGLETLFDA